MLRRRLCTQSKSKKCDPDRVCQGVDIVRCRKNALANAPFPLPVFCPLDNIRPAEEGHLADLTFVRKKEDRRAGLAGRLPYVGPGWYGKPATAFMLDTGLASWADFEWSLDAAAHVSPDCLARALEIMERAWPEGEEHMAKLAVNALIGLWARSKDVFYSMRTSNHEVDGRGCQYQQVFFDDRGQCHYDHVYATELFSNRSMRPPRFRDGFGVRGGEDPPGAARGAASLPGGDENRLPGLSEPSAKVRACGGGADQAAPPGQHAEVSLRGGETTGGRVPGAAAGDGAADGAGALAPRGGSRGALPQRPQPLVVRHAGHRQDAPGEADRVAALAARPRGHPDLQDALQRPEPRAGGADSGPLGAEDHPRGALLAGLAGGRGGHATRRGAVGRRRRGFHEPPGPVSAPRRLPTAAGRAGCLRRGPGAADAEGVPAAARLGGRLRARADGEPRSDERIFRFLQYLRVDEAEQVPLRDAVQVAREQFPMRGLPDTCLLISHAHRMAINDWENRRLAPEGAVLLEHRAQGPAGTNQPRLWPGLRLVGAGGRVPKGCFVTVREAGERIVLDDGQSFTPAELLRSTRLCHAITYASCQGLTLRGRVWLCDTLNPHFSVKHLYVEASRCTGAELLSVL